MRELDCEAERGFDEAEAFHADAAMKLIFMILRRISKRWTMPIRNWGEAMHQFSVIYGDRVPL